MRKLAAASYLLILLIVVLPLASVEVQAIKRSLPIKEDVKEEVVVIPINITKPKPELKLKHRVVFGKTVYDGRDDYYGTYLHAYRSNSSGIAFVYITTERELTIESVKLRFPWGYYEAYDVPKSLGAGSEAVFTVEFKTFESTPFHPILEVAYSDYTGSYTFSELIDETLCVYSDAQADAMEKIQEAAILIGLKYVFGGIFRPQFTTGEGKEYSYKVFQKLIEAFTNYKKGDFVLAKECAEESLNLIDTAIKAEKRVDEVESLKATSSLLYSIGITIGLLSIGAGLILISIRKR